MANRLIARTALFLVLVAVTLVGCRHPNQNQVAASPNEKRDYLGGTEDVSLYLEAPYTWTQPAAMSPTATP